eukprot:gene19519-26192_t
MLTGEAVAVSAVGGSITARCGGGCDSCIAQLYKWIPNHVHKASWEAVTVSAVGGSTTCMRHDVYPTSLFAPDRVFHLNWLTGEAVTVSAVGGSTTCMRHHVYPTSLFAPDRVFHLNWLTGEAVTVSAVGGSTTCMRHHVYPTSLFAPDRAFHLNWLTGEAVTVSAVGGSITARCGGGCDSYIVQLYKWIQNHFPNPGHMHRSGAVPGTSSPYLSACLEAHLESDPDLVIIGEHCVTGLGFCDEMYVRHWSATCTAVGLYKALQVPTCQPALKHI